MCDEINFDIKPGRKYILRDKSIASIKSVSSTPPFAVRGSIDKLVSCSVGWTAGGKYSTTNPKHQWDIVEEIKLW